MKFLTLLAIFPLLAATPTAVTIDGEGEVLTYGAPKPYEAQNYDHLLGMKGFSDDALKTHFILYEGYVKNANLLLNQLNDYAKAGQTNTHQFADLKRRLGWEMDGMRLHEIYFSSLGGNGQIDENSALYQQIVNDFGSYDAWQEEFESVGRMRGIGWAILYQDPETGRLINMWVNEHDHGHLAGGTVILPMDVFEHAYMLDYGLDRQGYIDAYFNNIDWTVAEERYDQANLAK